MRILVADQNAMLLAAITATFGPHCDLVTATRRDVCLGVLEQHKFDVVIACDKLSDYTGLELLSEVPVISPDTLLVFAADARRLKQLGKRLAVFGLFDALSYPLTPQKIVDVLKRAHQRLQKGRAAASPAPAPPQPKVRHVVLESEWDTGERLGLVERELRTELTEDGGPSTHDEWSRAAEVGASEHGGRVDDCADDFVFEGPPPSVQAMAEPNRTTDDRQRTLGAAATGRGAASGEGSGLGVKPSAGRTFEGTPVVSEGNRGSGSRARTAGGVTAYEVVPSRGTSRPAQNDVVPALTHESGGAESGRADEFVFASESDVTTNPARAHTGSGVSAVTANPVGRSAAAESLRAIEVEPCPDVPVSQEPTSIDELVCNDPVFDIPEPPKWAQDGAANDMAYEGKPGAAANEGHSANGGMPDLTQSAARESGREVAWNSARARSSQRPNEETAQASSAAASLRETPQASGAAASLKSPKSPQAGKPPPPSKGAQPRVRAQSVPTPSQLAAFERAMARRIAAQMAGPEKPPAGARRHKAAKAPPDSGRAEPTIQLAGGFSGLAKLPSRSLSELARMATTKRPLAFANPGKTAVPKRTVFAVSSGLAAVLILGVLSFELLRNSNEAEHHMPHAQAQSVQVFSSSTALLATSDGAGAARLAEPPENSEPPNLPLDLPQPQTFNPDTAPPDPPPPPALEQPGPMEPPSIMERTGPPPGMMPNSDGASE